MTKWIFEPRMGHDGYRKYGNKTERRIMRSLGYYTFKNERQLKWSQVLAGAK
jgi:hypothetical protein